jgi:hypothetical protein
MTEKETRNTRAYRQGIAHERERILTLIRRPGFHVWDADGSHSKDHCVTCNAIIQIQGEKE